MNIDGDGSMLMNIQELATIHVERLPVKCIILNNQHMGMVVQWEDLKYDSNRAQTLSLIHISSSMIRENVSRTEFSI